MTARTRLRTLELTGPRAAIRRAAFLAIVASAVLAAIAFVLPAHRLVYVPSSGGYLDLAAQRGDDFFHSLLDDGGPLSLVALITVAVVALVLVRTRRLGVGIVTGVLAAGGAVVAVAPVLLVHLFSSYESAIGEDLFSIGVLALFFIGVVLAIGEPILYLLERRRIERASRPAALPVARATKLAHRVA